MRKTFLLLIILSFFLAVGCGNTSGSPTLNSSEKHKIIIDTDTGADDSAALILASCNDNLEILGVTTLAGNVDLEQSTKNALAALEIAGCNAPVYKGSDNTYTGRTIDAYSVFGNDGMGDKDLIHPTGQAEKQDAVSFIIDTVKANPGEIEIVSLGPATNIAKAIDQDPMTMMQVKRIWSMGTAGQGPGNATPVAEFNVILDAEAYKVMLDSGIPITIVGLDSCDGEAQWTAAQFNELKKAGEIGSFITDSFSTLREFYIQNFNEDLVMNCDPLTVMCLMYPDIIKETISASGSCITDEGETYGQVLFYINGFTYDVAKKDCLYNITLVSELDKKNYFNYYLKTIKNRSKK